MSKKLTKEQQNLIVEHMTFTHKLVNKMMSKLGLDSRHFEDVLAFAHEGLSEAAARYDAARGVAFSTFAYYRIRGSIYDGIKEHAMLPRQLKTTVLAEQRSNEYLEQAALASAAARRAGGSPSGRSGSSAAQTIMEIGAHLAHVATIQQVALQTEEEIVDPESENESIEQKVSKRERNAQLRDVLDTLPDSEKNLLVAMYLQDQSLSAAGRQLGMSRSWASRLHSRAIRRLRSKISQNETFF
jgi:RNA polymerase sigma factor for flagellar operon FliA